MDQEIDLEKLINKQKTLAKKVCREIPNGFNPKVIAGLDISYSKNSDLAVAMAVSLDFETKNILEKSFIKVKVKFPYISTFLGFREVSFYHSIIKKLKIKPDLLLVDGFGILHPRGLGSASHLGVIVKIPTVGVGKSKFIGQPDFNPEIPGEWSPIRFNNKILGVLLKPYKGKNIYISIGNLIDLETAIDLTYKMIMPGKRLPEPIFLADKFSRELLNKEHL